MGGATNCPETPRQKMIGMMYIVLTAMLALNVSASILEGFTMVEHSLRVNTKGSENRNKNLYAKFEDLYNRNPAKIGEWLTKAKKVKQESDKLYKQLDDLKLLIVRAADGSKGNLEHIEAKDNLDAAGRMCLDPSQGGQGHGKEIKKSIDSYRDFLLTLVKADTAKISLIKKTFDTGMQVGHGGEKMPWDVATFEMMPVAAVTTILSKVQADVRSMEGEVVTYLKGMVDADDFRVNKIEAKVIPSSKYIIQGGKYVADIILAASDTTQRPEVYIGGNSESGVGGTLVDKGHYERVASSIGDQKYNGYIRVKRPDGSSKVYPFESDFSVGLPSATISADKMNVFYAGIDNDVSISVPGVPSTAVSASMTGGSLIKTAKGGWVARPAKVGQECVISVIAKIDGKPQKMGAKNFRVKMLPPPIAYIPYRDGGGNMMKYKGGEKIAKQYLLGISTLKAELNDADIEARFDVLGFELNITEAMGTSVEASAGASFTDKQLAYIKKLAKGKKFFISGVRAKGPDNIERKLPPMEVIVN
ncbi:MAG: gliding motility protein GldM [Paludibacteraceae bacterium]|nr:gliding motility protein GldM [Paludibacteraceae bacterium]